MLFRQNISCLLCVFTVSPLWVLAEATVEKYTHDELISDIKDGHFSQLKLETKIWPNNHLYNVESGAVPKPTPKITEPTATDISANALTENTAVIAPVAVPPTDSVNAGVNDTLLSTLSAQQIMTLRQQTASRLKVALEYQPHFLAPQFSIIPPGRFRMGDIQGGGDFDETPVRELRIAKAFGMSTTEVTFDLWDKCVQAGACSEAAHKQRGGDQGWGRGQRPLINVSWTEIEQQFIPWLNDLTGKHFRLPTEAEWEYAARAGSDTAYSSGATLERSEANFGKEKCCGGATKQQDKWEFTAPVARLKPNRFGLYDMHGNVYEWVYDCYSGNYEGAASSGECSSGKRVARGGSWYDAEASLRSANRVKFSENFRIIYLGFRLVHVIE